MENTTESNTNNAPTAPAAPRGAAHATAPATGTTGRGGDRFAEGDRVVLGGLKAEKYNGVRGNVTKVVTKNGEVRVGVRISAEKVIAVREQNVRHCLSAPAGPAAITIDDRADLDFTVTYCMAPSTAYERWRVSERGWSFEEFLCFVRGGVSAIRPVHTTCRGQFVLMDTLVALAAQITHTSFCLNGDYRLERGSFGPAENKHGLMDYTVWSPDPAGRSTKVYVTNEGDGVRYTGFTNKDYAAFKRVCTVGEGIAEEEIFRVFTMFYLGNTCSYASQVLSCALEMANAAGIGIVFPNGSLLSEFQFHRTSLLCCPTDPATVVGFDFGDYEETSPRDTPDKTLHPHTAGDKGDARNALAPWLTKPYGHEVVEVHGAGNRYTIDLTPQFIGPRGMKTMGAAGGGKSQWFFQTFPGSCDEYVSTNPRLHMTVEGALDGKDNVCRTATLLSAQRVRVIGESIERAVIPVHYAERVARMIAQSSGRRTVGGDSGGGAAADSKKVRRNAPCPCNSGKKYKKCCGNKKKRA